MARNFTKKLVLKAIKDSYGVVGTVAGRLDCDWNTAKRYIDKWPETQQAILDERESYLDLTENQCIERIKQGDGQMIRFVLATVGKKRGYGTEERPEDTSAETETEPLTIVCDNADTAPVEADE